ncbi:hypothetical protein EB169_05360 [archaeon]|nr:hypothetical protein [archaeon]
MKKLALFLIISLGITGCFKDDFAPTPVVPTSELQINGVSGIKLQSTFVTTEVAMNVKIENKGIVTIKIFDIANRVISKETADAYRIGLYDSAGKLLGITDFNKL